MDTRRVGDAGYSPLQLALALNWVEDRKGPPVLSFVTAPTTSDEDVCRSVSNAVGIHVPCLGTKWCLCGQLDLS